VPSFDRFDKTGACDKRTAMHTLPMGRLTRHKSRDNLAIFFACDGAPLHRLINDWHGNHTWAAVDMCCRREGKCARKLVSNAISFTADNQVRAYNTVLSSRIDLYV